jgi:hypothetical protein
VSVRLLSLLLAVLVAALAPSIATAEAPDGAGWEELRQAPFTFHFQHKDERLARALARLSDETADAIGDATGLPVPRHIDVILAPDAGTFASVQPSPPPSWAAGTAWSERSEIYLRTRLPRSGPNRLDQVFAHEVVHIVLGRAWTHGHPPRWLNEGLAKYLAGELEPGDHALLSRQALGGGLLPLETFTTRWPARASQARLAYVQSVDFVSFLARQGEDVLPTVVQEMAGGAALDAALLTATGEELGPLEERWRSRITVWHGLVPLLGSSGTVWGFGAILFVIAGVKRRMAFYKKRAELEEKERLSAEEPSW